MNISQNLKKRKSEITLKHTLSNLNTHGVTRNSVRPIDVRSRGALLLEVLIGLAIFVVTALFVLSGLSSSVAAVSHTDRLSMASDLLVTLDSEIQMGLHELVTTGPETYDTGDELRDEQLQGWTWEIIVEKPQDLPDIENLNYVEMIIRYEADNIIVRRGRMLWLDPNAPTPEEVAEANAALEEAESELPEGELPEGVLP